MIKKILVWSQGRHTAFAIFFTVMGTTMAWFHRLDPSYIALVGAIQAFVFAHSAKEDYFEKKNEQDAPDDSTK
jgi:hypothetical protein